MNVKKNIFVIIGSAGDNSANRKLVDNLERLTTEDFNLTVYDSLKTLPHFDPELSAASLPEEVILFMNKVETADGILISTPEYVFSIPSGLKNAIEWCVATTVFSGKPLGMITASANGEKGHEELQLIMETLMARFNKETTLLIKGIKGKINEQGEISDARTREDVTKFIQAFKVLVGGD